MARGDDHVLLAIASPTHPVPASLYHLGWASGGGMVNGGTFLATRWTWGLTGADRSSSPLQLPGFDREGDATSTRTTSSTIALTRW